MNLCKIRTGVSRFITKMEDALTRRLKIYQRQIIMNLTRRRQGCKNETQNRFIYDHCCYYSYDYDNL